MTYKPTSDMTRAELEQEINRLREDQAGTENSPNGSDANANSQAQPKSSNDPASDDVNSNADTVLLRRFLDDLGRLSARYGVWIEEGQNGSCLRISEDFAAGYIAWPIPDNDGSWGIDSYVNGATLDPNGTIIGDDHSEQGKSERARIWREENAEAIAQQASWMKEAPLPFTTAALPRHEDDPE